MKRRKKEQPPDVRPTMEEAVISIAALFGGLDVEAAAALGKKYRYARSKEGSPIPDGLPWSMRDTLHWLEDNR